MTQWTNDTVVVDGATVRYRTTGEGPTIVFVHGVYVGGSLWDALVERLPGFRCIVPTWPLGANVDHSPTADLSALAAAARIPHCLAALDLHDVTLVGNDTGGGLCLASLAVDHSRLARLVLTNCDSYEHFPPKGFDRIAAMSRTLPFMGKAFIKFLSSGPGRKFFLKAVCVHPPTGAAALRIFEGFATSKAARKDALAITKSLQPSVTLDAVPALQAFTKPVLLAWGEHDELFPIEHAERLHADFPNATLVKIADARAYVMIDQPDAVAAAITTFIG